jgi:hypothetical protein
MRTPRIECFEAIVGENKEDDVGRMGKDEIIIFGMTSILITRL